MNPKPITLKILDIVSILLFLTAAYIAIFVAPTERVMGDVQRVFYFHVGTAWVALIGFVFTSGLSVIYLVTKNLKWDRIQVAAVEVSVVFFLITIILGSIWARPAWNTWWTWDPRLTTATVTELIYIAYFMLRQGLDDPNKRARFGAVYALIGGLSAPITFFSIRLYRTIHPVVIAGSNTAAQGSFNMTDEMLKTFFFALFAFTVIFIDLFWNRIRLGETQEKVEEMKMKAAY
jgi:heme exporter protein C